MFKIADKTEWLTWFAEPAATEECGWSIRVAWGVMGITNFVVVFISWVTFVDWMFRSDVDLGDKSVGFL